MKEKLQDQETVKTCPVCGDKYYKDEKFCSRECEEKFNKRKKVCAYCGNEFYPKNNIQKYCNDTCSYKRKKEEKQKKYQASQSEKEFPIIKCNYCEKEFEQKHKLTMYCSNKCRNKHSKEHNKNNNIKKEAKITPKKEKKQKNRTKTCLFCGTEFEADHLSKQYCSETCKKSAKRQKNIERGITTEYVKTCEYCGNEFKTTHPSTKYCDNCKIEARKSKKREWQKTNRDEMRKYRTGKRKAEKPVYEDKLCPVCGTVFTPKYYNQVYCCEKCLNYSKNHRNDLLQQKEPQAKFIDLYSEPESVHCKVCGTLFMPNEERKEFCSDTCEKYFNTVKKPRIEKQFEDSDPWHSGRFPEEVTANQFTGWNI